MNSVARRGRHAVFRYGRLMTWLVSGVLIIVLSSYVALPLALSLYVPQLAAQHGLRLHVERVRIEPLKARFLFSDVRAETTGGLPIEWSGIEAQVDLAALLSGRFALGSLRLIDAKLFAGEPWTGEVDAIPAIPVDLLEKMSVGELVVDRAELVTISETLGHPVTIDWLRVESLDDAFRPKGAMVQADVSIGEGRSTFQGRFAVNAADWTLDTEIRANDVPLDGFPALDRFDGALRGRLDGSGPLRFVYSSATGAFSLTTGVYGGCRSGDPRHRRGASFARAGRRRREIRSRSRRQRSPLQVAASQTPRARSVGSRGTAPRSASATREASIRSDRRGGQERRLARHAHVRRRPRSRDRPAGVRCAHCEAPAGRSIDVERLRIEGIATGSNTDVVSVAAATTERVEWQGFATAQGHGTAGTARRAGIRTPCRRRASVRTRFGGNHRRKRRPPRSAAA